MRFDSLEYLDQWQREGRYPAIHDEMFAVVTSRVVGRRYLDLCCSTGLLGQRIAAKAWAETVVGVDGDNGALQAGKDAGINVPLIHLAITDTTMDQLGDLIRQHGLTVMLARRCLPELSDGDPERAKRLLAITAKAGITEIVVQGRDVSRRTTHVLGSIEREIAVIEPFFAVKWKGGQMAYGRRRA